jgi:hypothetical protein
MDSQDTAFVKNDPPSSLQYKGKKFKMKSHIPSVSKPSSPPSHVWVINTNLNATTLSQPSFTAMVANDSTIVTSTVEKAREKAMEVAGFFEYKNGWRNLDFNMEGEGALGDGDLYCTIRNRWSERQAAQL